MRPYRPFVFVAALIATVYMVGWFSFVDRGLEDARTHLYSRPASGDLMLVVIDPASLRALRGWPWPWPRRYHAAVLKRLIAAGARVRGYDPVARQTAAPHMPAVEIYDDVYKMAEGCDALVVVTPWNEFKQLDLDKLKELLKSPIIYDGRNIYDPKVMKEMGFTYRAIGRASNGK